MTVSTPVSWGTGPHSSVRACRLAAILDQLSSAQVISLAQLCKLLGVSTATVRRDVALLADQKLLIRTHGGVIARAGADEVPVALRDTRCQEAKRAIALRVRQRIPDDRSVIALSGGTTTAGVARTLAYYRELAVVTNSVMIAQILAAYPGIRVAVTGGYLRPESLELVGPLAEKAFAARNFATAILGADGVSANEGITTHDETEARTNLAMAARAKQTIVVADGSKIGHAALAQVAELSQIDTLVTDDSADIDELSRISQAGVEVIVARSRAERL